MTARVYLISKVVTTPETPGFSGVFVLEKHQNNRQGAQIMPAKALLVAALIAALSGPAFAQAPQGTPTNVRGTIVKLDGQVLTVKSPAGKMVAVNLAPNVAVRTAVRKKLSDIHPGDFVGSTAVPGDDGMLHAVEVHFFPANAPIPDSQAPWDTRPNSLMTNAHVTGVAKAPHGQMLSLDYKKGTAQIIIGPNTPIVGPGPGTTDDLKRGKAVFMVARKGDDGTLTAANVTVEKNGVKPPM